MPPQEGLERVSAAAASESGSGAESTGIGLHSVLQGAKAGGGRAWLTAQPGVGEVPCGCESERRVFTVDSCERTGVGAERATHTPVITTSEVFTTTASGRDVLKVTVWDCPWTC